jgi:hypothetical protein
MLNLPAAQADDMAQTQVEALGRLQLLTVDKYTMLASRVGNVDLVPPQLKLGVLA